MGKVGIKRIKVLWVGFLVFFVCFVLFVCFWGVFVGFYFWTLGL